jgi:hypothetical protein
MTQRPCGGSLKQNPHFPVIFDIRQQNGGLSQLGPEPNMGIPQPGRVR